MSFKTKDAAECLDRRLGISWERSRLAQAKGTPTCEVRLDRLEATADEISDAAILGIPGTRRIKKHRLRRKRSNDFLPYGVVTRFTTSGSIREIVVLSAPQMPHLAKCKLTLIADDLGLQPQDVLSVLELLSGVTLKLVEIAFDFGYGSGVDGAFVRAHALFGKSRPNKVASIRGYDSWGARKGGKFVRSYYK